MRDRITHENLFNSVSQVFEEAAFNLIQDYEEDIVYIPKNICSRMDFRGPVSGTVYLVTSPSQAAQLAGNLLGLDEDDEEVMEKCPAAVNELLNMVVGIFVNQVYGESQSYTLGIPSLKSLSQEDFEDLVTKAVVNCAFIDDMDNVFFSFVTV